MDLSNGKELGFPPEDIVFRLRAKMDDNSYTSIEEGGRKLLVFRVQGEKIDLLNSLEYLSEFLDEDAVEEADKLIIISDREFEVTPADVLGPKMETKNKDDEKLYGELKEKLTDRLKPIVFTVENDILELYRVAVRMDGSMDRTDGSVGLDLMKMDLPKEGDVVYLVFDDGYRKISRSAFQSLIDDALEGLREGPSLAKDPSRSSMVRSSLEKDTKETVERKGAVEPAESHKGAGTMDHRNDPRVLVRDFSKKMISLGYRKDATFSRQDVNQVFYVGMSGPPLLFKVLDNKDEMGSFLRILEHRKDSLGILISREWHPDLEAISRVRGFVYLDWSRAFRASEVVSSIIREESE